MNNLLSIFIPTYNRSDILNSVMDCVITAVGTYEIPIYVYNNASSDNTKDVIRNKQKIYKYIFYIENSVNIGLDRNMLNVLDCQSTKYSLMLGDDDFITEDFYLNILPFLKSDFDFIVLSTNLNYKSQVFSDKIEAFSFLWDKMPYGTLIIRNGFVEKNKIKKYIGTSHAYSAIPWEIMNASDSYGKCMFYSDNILVKLGVIEKTWKSNAIDILLYQIPLWFNCLPTQYFLKDMVLKKYMKNMLSFRQLIALKRSYNFNSLTSNCYFSLYQKIKFNLIKKISCI